MTATWAERIDDTVYVYVRGRLVMKRFLRYGVTTLFHACPGYVAHSKSEAHAMTSGPANPDWI